MTAKLCIFAALFLGMNSGTFAGEEDYGLGDLEGVVIVFVVLCTLVLLVALIVPFILLWTTRQARSDSSDTEDSDKYQKMSPDSDKQPQEEGDGYVSMEGGSIKKQDQREDQHTYAALTKNNAIDQSENVYEMPDRSDLKKETSDNEYDNPDTVIDEEGKSGANVRTEQENAYLDLVGYDNPEALKGDDNKDCDNEYYFQMADTNVSVRGPAAYQYENPVIVDDQVVEVTSL